MKFTYENLNDKQKQAVDHIKGPCIVLAGPGSGKTRVITHRIVNLIENNINPQNILAISFTKSSALEMKDRTIRLSSGASRVNFGTFHSIFFNILRNFRNYTMENILDEKNKRYIFKNILKTCHIENYEDDEFISSIINEISFVTNELMNVNEFESSLVSNDEFTRIYDMYRKYKIDMKKIDFDDMLIHTYNLLKDNDDVLSIVANKYKYVLIDEFQDVNKVQFEVLKLIVKYTQNIFVVGDEDQSIYGFRGARPDFLLQFEKYFSPVNKIILDINYRSTDKIIDGSNKLISNNSKRYEKVIKGLKKSNENIEYISSNDSEEEGRKIGKIINSIVDNKNLYYSDIAIIYRTNMQARAVIDVFMDMNIPFVVKDSMITLYDHWVAKDIIAYLKLCIDIKLKDEFARIINKPFRYISKDNINFALKSNDFINCIKSKLLPWQIKTIEDLEIDINYISCLPPKEAISYIRTTLEYDRHILDYCSQRKIKSTGLFDILNEIESSGASFQTINEYLTHIEKVKDEITSKSNEDSDSVVLTTIHSSKGLEFKNVFIIGAIEGVMPHEKSFEDEELIEEERRLFYVAMTRAMEKLYISYIRNRYGKRAYMSRFIEEVSSVTYDELNSIKQGDNVYHKIFKDGKVISKKGNIIEVKFKYEIKTLDYETCLKYNILQKL
ncbi:ATP-dependent helicase [Alkalithermobacter paradoxus]|uniref:DNA 3'-5' helicase n=1 Tax=Alkalithermobacter paradoxus TaxID=29349 RepID=A0A1V4I5I6_9FIRM|nr:putative ATP-dependent DNA helicase YjcD [[Clostridium] thermoalcaliphilum]